MYFCTMTKLGHMIPLWKGKNPIYFGVITIIPFDNLYRQAYFVMHTFLVYIYQLFFQNNSNSACASPCSEDFFLWKFTQNCIPQLFCLSEMVLGLKRLSWPNFIVSYKCSTVVLTKKNLIYVRATNHDFTAKIWVDSDFKWSYFGPLNFLSLYCRALITYNKIRST
jgi:hypothetical protein